MKRTIKLLPVLLACLLLLDVNYPSYVKATENQDFAIEHDSESGKTLIMLGDELYEANYNGDLSYVDEEEMSQRGYNDIPDGMMSAVLIGPISKVLSNAARWLWKHCKNWDFVKKIKRWIFPRKITKYEKNLIKESKVKEFDGKIVSKRDKIINTVKQCLGSSSCKEMWKGNSPFDDKCERIQLHHIAQEDDGVIIELTSDEHKNKDIHTNNYSEIDRNQFNAWKRKYWDDRYYELCK